MLQGMSIAIDISCPLRQQFQLENEEVIMFLNKFLSLTTICLALALICQPGFAQNESTIQNASSENPAAPHQQHEPNSANASPQTPVVANPQNIQTGQPISSGCQTEDPTSQPWVQSLYQEYQGNNSSVESSQETSTESPTTWLRREVDIGRKIFYKCSPLLNQSNQCKDKQTDLEKKFVKFILEVHARKIIAAKYANNKFLKRFAKGSETPAQWWTHQTDFLKESFSMKCE